MSVLRAGAYSAGVSLGLILAVCATGDMGPCGPSNPLLELPFLTGLLGFPIGLILMLVGGMTKLWRRKA
jgi:hypothetical protein